MAVLTADLESRTAELSDSSFEAFCDDIAAMFDADVTCARQDTGTGTVKDVQKHFKKLAAVHHVEATGALNGTFHLFFDQGGLFTLSGVIVMLPERRIREEIKRGSIDEAENLTDAAREVGNLLVGSWDRIFREESEGHDHFLKTGTFIGKPWENLEELGLSADEELLFVRYEMTVEPYPSFCCAAIFPKSALIGSASPAEEASPPAPEAEVAASAEAAPESPAVAVVEQTPAPETPAPSEEATPAKAAATAVEQTPVPETPVPSEEAAPAEPSPAPATEPAATTNPVPAAVAPVVDKQPELVATPTPAEKVTAAPETHIPEDIRSTVEAVVGAADRAEPKASAPPAAAPPAQSAGGYLDRMFEDIVEYSSDTGLAPMLKTPAKDIMVPEVVWSDPEDTVQDVISKMQQHNTGYVLIGTDGVLEGLVSNSNILGAVSPYLRPMFAKWRRPEDDATLGIKVKWVMSRPVRTVAPDSTLASMIESMRRYGGRCLPVVDKQAEVLGIITVFDILLRVLEADKAFSWKGKPPQAPPLLI